MKAPDCPTPSFPRRRPHGGRGPRLPRGAGGPEEVRGLLKTAVWTNSVHCGKHKRAGRFAPESTTFSYIPAMASPSIRALIEDPVEISHWEAQNPHDIELVRLGRLHLGKHLLSMAVI